MSAHLFLSVALLDPAVILAAVAEVRVVRDGSPRNRIVHLLDYHHVPRDLFLLDLQQFRGEQFTKEQADKEFANFLDVEQVQKQQIAVLRWLKPKKVFCEGLCPEGMAEFRKLIESMVEFERRFKAATDREQKALFQVLMSDREARLNIGAAGRLLFQREANQGRS
jgi:hypothetical protein